MPRESIGSCGTSQSSSEDWAVSELELGICYIRQACGEPPKGYELEVIWHEHELGEYPTIGITWDGPADAPWEYIRDAEEALSRFHEAVDWSALEPPERPNDDAEDDEEAEMDEGAATSEPALIEIYRREGSLELQAADWEMALLIFKEMGWKPERPFETYVNPLAFVKDYEAEAMRSAGQALFAVINDEPAVSTSVQMDLGLFHRITEFVGAVHLLSEETVPTKKPNATATSDVS